MDVSRSESEFTIHTDEEAEYTLQLYEGYFPDSNFIVTIPLDNIDDLVTDHISLLIKIEYNCGCFDEERFPQYYYIQGKKGQQLTNKFVIQELLRQGYNTECIHDYLDGFRRVEDTQTIYNIITSS